MSCYKYTKYTLPEPNSKFTTENRPKRAPKANESSSNQQFSGANCHVSFRECSYRREFQKTQALNIICPSLPNTSLEGVLDMFFGSNYLQTQGVWKPRDSRILMTYYIKCTLRDFKVGIFNILDTTRYHLERKNPSKTNNQI